MSHKAGLCERLGFRVSEHARGDDRHGLDGHVAHAGLDARADLGDFVDHVLALDDAAEDAVALAVGGLGGVEEAVVRNGAVYLAALGGAGALMAKSVQTLEVIAWPDLGCEAVRRLTVQDMPLTVVLDAHGGDLYEEGPAAYLAAR